MLRTGIAAHGLPGSIHMRLINRAGLWDFFHLLWEWSFLIRGRALVSRREPLIRNLEPAGRLNLCSHGEKHPPRRIEGAEMGAYIESMDRQDLTGAKKKTQLRQHLDRSNLGRFPPKKMVCVF